MQTSLAIASLKSIPHIFVGSEIKLSLSDNTVIGVNVHASSSIRKQEFTKELMKKWCAERGYKLMDKYPQHASMQVIF